METGFPSPAADYSQRPLDLNALAIKHPSATFLLRAKDNSMRGAGIFFGDILLVDRAVKPFDGSVVVADIEGKLLLKRLFIRGVRPYLAEETANNPTIALDTRECEFSVWGVVTFVLHDPNSAYVKPK